MRMHRIRRLPFGGIQLLVCGVVRGQVLEPETRRHRKVQRFTTPNSRAALAGGR